MSVTLFLPTAVLNSQFSDCQSQGKLEKPRHGCTPPKVLKIKNFRGRPLLGLNYIDRAKGNLYNKLEYLLWEDRTELSLEELYRTVEDLVFLDQRNEIFQILYHVNTIFLNKKLESLMQINSPKELLTALTDLWNYYSKKVTLLKNIYLWHDRSENEYRFNKTQITCLELFKAIIILNPCISRQITRQILEEVRLERHGSTIDRNRLSTMLSVLIDLNVYGAIFEQYFLAESRKFYELGGRQIGENAMGVKEYLLFVRDKIREETDRNYVLKDTEQETLAILYEEMIESYEEHILTQGFRQLMDEPCLASLRLLFNLFTKGPTGLFNISRYFQSYLDDLCVSIIQKGTDKMMIQVLIDLRDKLDTIVEKCFRNNPKFAVLIRASYVKAINLRNSESALFLAKYLDSKLRSKNIWEDELNVILNKVMLIFRCINGKDIFEVFYRKYLAKRLIFGSSTNQDVEESIVYKLEEECGDCFTAKIKGMLTDVHSSETINSNFKEFLFNTHPEFGQKCDLSVLVLTSSIWTKTVGNYMLILPDELLNYQAIFSGYYVSIHTGRRLDWQPSLGHCIVKAYFDAGIKELSVSLFQTIVLLQFNKRSKLSLNEIQEYTMLDCKDLILTLYSLACTKTKLLIKEPQNNYIQQDDTFELNVNFTNKLSRIKISQVQLRDNREELKVAERNVLADRQMQIDAAIVRILKNKKVMKHNELMSELFSVLDIPLKSQDLKKRIETLIEREYIQRDVENSATYTYIA
ncbi:cullin-4B-like [Anthonomus grandis grandis]|uniref:cullin-4B-like n=1 Tax=Anthonomus grandis grandis TaxID=2921223 RepID=UPI0021669F8F|nr:cullin-4B-like [Anthonomus grandis grandis]